MSTAGQRRILIVGGGFIGMYAARRLERLTRAGHRVTLVNPENFMQYQPFLPEVASGTIDPRAVVVPLRQVLRRTELLIGEVERIDHEARLAMVRLPDGQTPALLWRIAADLGEQVRYLRPHRSSLEDVFLQAVGD